MTKNYAVTFTGNRQAELLLSPLGQEPLQNDELVYDTLYSLISPGTELNFGFLGSGPYPQHTGYASVGRVAEIADGAAAAGIKPGDLVFSMHNHASRVKARAGSCIVLPAGLDPAIAPIARLMGVSMTTLTTTSARPGDRVLISGAGPVGYLAAHLFRHAGYAVTVCEPDEERRQVVAASGIADVRASVAVKADGLAPYALVVECSGHEAAVLNALRSVRRHGEVVTIGVPWQRKTDHTAHEILWEVFHNYAVLRSGWEWELPLHADESRPHSIFGNLTTAAGWLAAGVIPVDGLVRYVSPADAQQVYESLEQRSWKELFIVFDWTKLSS